MDEEPLHPWIDPGLEARLVALVLGEASDFEREELERLCKEDGDLAAFRARMETLHGMLREVGKGESSEGEWRLSAERRRVVEERLAAEPVMPNPKSEAEHQQRKSNHHRLLATAAVLTFAAILAGTMMPAYNSVSHRGRESSLPEQHFAYFEDPAAESGTLSVGRISIDGNETTKDQVISRQLGDRELDAEVDVRFREGADLSRNLVMFDDEEIRIEEMRRERPRVATTAELAEIETEAGTDYLASSETREKTNTEEAIRPRLAAAKPQALTRSDEEGRYADVDDAITNLAVVDEQIREVEEKIPFFGDLPEAGLLPQEQEEAKTFASGGTSGGAVRIGGDFAGQDVVSNEGRIAELDGTVALGSGRDILVEDGAGVKISLTTENAPSAQTGFPVVAPSAPAPADGLALTMPGQASEPFFPDFENGAGNSLSEPFVNESTGANANTLFGRHFLGGANNLRGFDYREANDVPSQLNLETNAGGIAWDNLQASTGRGSGGLIVNGNVTTSGSVTIPEVGLEFPAKGHGQVVEIPTDSSGSTGELDNYAAGMVFDRDRMESLYQVVPRVVGGGSESDARVRYRDQDVAELPALGEKITPTEPSNDANTADSSIRLDYGYPLAGDDFTQEFRYQPAQNEWESYPDSENERRYAHIGHGGSANDLLHAGVMISFDETEPTYPSIDDLRRVPDPSEKQATDEPFSTFSLHVSDASFRLAKAALEKNEWPEADRVRIEEFVNAFDYGDPSPAGGEPVATTIEQAAHPFLQQRNLVRIAVRTAAEGRGSGTPLRLVFLLDNSGSMERVDRRETVGLAFSRLASHLREGDQVTLVAFARTPRLVADRIPGTEAATLAQTVAELPSEGGTNLEEALRLAFEKAKEQFDPAAQNRVVLLTDGAANLGDAEPESLAARITEMRDHGVALDIAGVGAEGLNDEILEALARRGDGRYFVLDRPEDADAGFAARLAGAFRPAAKNVKVQIEFNPDRVGAYRLLGFDKHRLKTEDFRDDSVDAAELSAAEAGVALYHVDARPEGTGEVGTVSVRFLDMATGRMVERRWPIPYEPVASPVERAAPSLRVATVAGLFAARLKNDPAGNAVHLDELSRVLAELPGRWREEPRVEDLRRMIETARLMEGR